MEQFLELGEALGSLKALLVFQENIEINKRQCVLLSDLFEAAFDLVSQEMRNSLRFDEKSTAKWKILEQPLRDLEWIFRDGEAYIRNCLEPAGDSSSSSSSLAVKAVLLHRNRDCVELHVHNLLVGIAVVVEAIETVGEASGSDQEEIRNKRRVYSGKYGKEFMDRRVFRWRFGKDYLIGREFRDRFESVWREDWCDLFAKSKKIVLIELLCKSFDASSSEVFTGSKLFPSSILSGSKDYQVKRRLGAGNQYKEIQWLGESFAMRHFFGDYEPHFPEISSMLSVSHPNISNALCGFAGEDKKEWFLITELMSKDLGSYIKEICGPRKRNVPFPVHVAVDLMLQIARGMEYLHSKGIRHGDLNPSNVLVKTIPNNHGGYVRAKVSGFDSFDRRKSSPLLCVWNAPEILEERDSGSRCSEESDVYSFGMVCFEILTGKVPFEDRGDKMSRNIKAGERPLFPFQAPKHLTGLTKKCWHADPAQRPTFSSLCRVLRYIKRFGSLNPAEDSPAPDYFEIESGLSRTFPGWSGQSSSVSEIPFQMFAYRVLEREKSSVNLKENSEESGSDAASVGGGDEAAIMVSVDDNVFLTNSERKALASSVKKSTTKPGTTRSKSVKPPQVKPIGRRNSETQLTLISPRLRRTSSGHASDSELP